MTIRCLSCSVAILCPRPNMGKGAGSRHSCGRITLAPIWPLEWLGKSKVLCRPFRLTAATSVHIIRHASGESRPAAATARHRHFASVLRHYHIADAGGRPFGSTLPHVQHPHTTTSTTTTADADDAWGLVQAESLLVDGRLAQQRLQDQERLTIAGVLAK